jgi:hypothetical protein
MQPKPVPSRGNAEEQRRVIMSPVIGSGRFTPATTNAGRQCLISALPCPLGYMSGGSGGFLKHYALTRLEDIMTSAELKQELVDTLYAMIQFDREIYGHVTQETKDCFKAQGVPFPTWIK